MARRATFVLIGLLALAWPRHAAAEDALSAMDTQKVHIELMAGYAWPMQFVPEQRWRQLVAVTPRLGIFLTDPLGDDAPLRGVPELLVQWNSYSQITPRGGWAGGLSTLFRWNIGTGSFWSPYLGGGVGLGYSDLGLPEESGKFSFQVEGAAGVHILVEEHVALTFEWRYQHFSNAGIYARNAGVNLSTLQGGVSFYF